MAAGEVESAAVARGIDYLKRAPREGARWDEELYNAVGFPRVFYLRYHGYSAYFPLWALARYRNLMRQNDRRVAWGMWGRGAGGCPPPRRKLSAAASGCLWPAYDVQARFSLGADNRLYRVRCARSPDQALPW